MVGVTTSLWTLINSVGMISMRSGEHGGALRLTRSIQAVVHVGAGFEARVHYNDGWYWYQGKNAVPCAGTSSRSQSVREIGVN